MTKPRAKSAISGNVRNRQRKNWGIKNGIIEIPIKIKINCKKLRDIVIILVMYYLLIKTFSISSVYQGDFSEYTIYFSLARDILNVMLSNHLK